MKELFDKLIKSESWFIKIEIPGTSNKYVWVSKIQWSKNFQISIFEEKKDLNMIDKWYREDLNKDNFKQKIETAINLSKIAMKNKIKSIYDMAEVWNSWWKLYYSFTGTEISFMNNCDIKVKTHLGKLFDKSGKKLRSDLVELSSMNEKWMAEAVIFFNGSTVSWFIDLQWKFIKK